MVRVTKLLLRFIAWPGEEVRTKEGASAAAGCWHLAWCLRPGYRQPACPGHLQPVQHQHVHQRPGIPTMGCSSPASCVSRRYWQPMCLKTGMQLTPSAHIPMGTISVPTRDHARRHVAPQQASLASSKYPERHTRNVNMHN